MFLWLQNHFGTILTAAVLCLLIAAVVAAMIREGRGGRSCCGCNCAHGAMAGKCHSQHTSDKKSGTK